MYICLPPICCSPLQPNRDYSSEVHGQKFKHEVGHDQALSKAEGHYLKVFPQQDSQKEGCRQCERSNREECSGDSYTYYERKVERRRSASCLERKHERVGPWFQRSAA